MSKNKIWAANVNNLSDARYFAAMGVDIMSFICADHQDMVRIHAIKDWVEGPKIAIELQGLEYSDLHSKFIEEIKADIVLSAPYLVLPSMDIPRYHTTIYPNFTEDSFQVIKIEDYDQNIDLQSITSLKNDNIFIDAPLSKDDLRAIKNNAPHIGFLIRGGNEIKVGIKSFDELDEFFDVLDE